MPSWIAYLALAVAAISLLVSLLVFARGRRTRGRASAASGGFAATEEGDTEQVAALASELVALGRRFDTAESRGRLAIQRVGVVRYNPFPDTGSNQSFVLALLDARGDGFVLSSLHSRQQTRVFLKQLTTGRAETALSEEETEAIRRATTS